MLMRPLDWFLETRLVDWYVHARMVGIVVFSLGMSGIGVSTAQAVAPAGNAKAVVTTTSTSHRLVTHTRLVTVHVKGRVLRRYDHVLVVLVPRVVFRNHTTHRRVIVPSHIVHIQEPGSSPFPVSAAVIGVSPPPVTVYVPVTVTIPGPTTTVTGPTTTVTLPQATTTVTVPTTITVLPPSG